MPQGNERFEAPCQSPEHFPVASYCNFRTLFLCLFVLGEVGAVFVVVQIVIDCVVLPGVAAGHIGGAAVVFLRLWLALLLVVHN
jgi:hypothetical protein